MENPSSQPRAPLEQLFLCDGVLPKGKHAGKQCKYPLVGRRSPQQEPSIDCPRCHKEWSICTLQSGLGAVGQAAPETRPEEEMMTATGCSVTEAKEALNSTMHSMTTRLNLAKAKEIGWAIEELEKAVRYLGFLDRAIEKLAQVSGATLNVSLSGDDFMVVISWINSHTLEQCEIEFPLSRRQCRIRLFSQDAVDKLFRDKRDIFMNKIETVFVHEAYGQLTGQSKKAYRPDRLDVRGETADVEICFYHAYLNFRVK